LDQISPLRLHRPLASPLPQSLRLRWLVPLVLVPLLAPLVPVLGVLVL
jgi:hypothetical protein